MCELDQSRERKPGGRRFQDDWVLDPQAVRSPPHSLRRVAAEARTPVSSSERTIQESSEAARNASTRTVSATGHVIHLLNGTTEPSESLCPGRARLRCSWIRNDGVNTPTGSLSYRITRPVSSMCRDLLRCQTVLNSTELNYFPHLCVVQDRAGGLCPCHKTSSSAEIRWWCRFC
jgi:hypothetical protein